MQDEVEKFQQWLVKAHHNVLFLQDQPLTIDGVHFFGETMWTDFLDGSEKAMIEARAQMNDFWLIKMVDYLSHAALHYKTT